MISALVNNIHFSTLPLLHLMYRSIRSLVKQGLDRNTRLLLNTVTSPSLSPIPNQLAFTFAHFDLERNLKISLNHFVGYGKKATDTTLDILATGNTKSRHHNGGKQAPRAGLVMEIDSVTDVPRFLILNPD